MQIKVKFKIKILPVGLQSRKHMYEDKGKEQGHIQSETGESSRKFVGC